MLKSSGMQTILPQSMEEEAKMHSSDFAQAVLQSGWGGAQPPPIAQPLLLPFHPATHV